MTPFQLAPPSGPSPHPSMHKHRCHHLYSHHKHTWSCMSEMRGEMTTAGLPSTSGGTW